MDDFKRPGFSDTIYCEYEHLRPSGVDQVSLQHNDNGESNDWKLYRPSFAKSIGKCMICSFSCTVLGGVFVGMVATVVIWLIINLAGSCFGFKGEYEKWYEAPIYIQRIHMTVEAVEGSMIQLWSFVNFLAVFRWPLMKELNLHNWNLLVSFVNGLYVPLMNVYGLYNRSWINFPMFGLFLSITLFNGYRIARFYRQRVKERLYLAIRLGGQFYMGFPLAMFFYIFIIPFCLKLSEKKLAIIVSFIPSIVIMPKLLGRMLVQKLQGINHPGTSGILLIVLNIGGATVFRVLQVSFENLSLFVLLSVIHGLIGIIDKLIAPLQDYIYNIYDKCWKRSTRKHIKTPRVNRFLADLALLSIVVETSSVFVNCALVQIFRFYFGRDENGMKYNEYALLKDFLGRITIAVFIEWIFNTLTIKLQTYYYNIPVVKVWNSKWRWITILVILNTIPALLFFTEPLLAVVENKTVLVDPKTKLECVRPFHRP